MKINRENRLMKLAILLLLTASAFGQSIYRINGVSLPDLVATPGAVRPSCTAAEICSPAFRTGPIRKSIRNFAGLKRKACTAYGLIKCDKSTEGDHLISLELCGCPDCLTNIWPQIMAEARVKDVTEGKLHRWTCKGETALVRADRLDVAQKCIATDWTTCAKEMQ